MEDHEISGPVDLVQEIDQFGEAHAFEGDMDRGEVGGARDGAAAIVDTGACGKPPVTDSAVDEGEQIEPWFGGQSFPENGLFLAISDYTVVDGLGLFEPIASLFEFLFGLLEGPKRSFADEVQHDCEGGDAATDQHSAFAVL